MIPVGEGVVLVKACGTPGFHPLEQAEQVPLCSIVDTREGRVEVITEKNKSGKLQDVELWAGMFVLDQVGGPKPLVTFELTGPLGGPTLRTAAAKSVAARKAGSRKLWGRGNCNCRTGGRHSSGTVRGTWWLTVDRRNETLTRVKKGVVKVRDFRKGRKVRVRAGEQYIARAAGR